MYKSPTPSRCHRLSLSPGDSRPAWSKSYVYLGGRLLSTVAPNGSGGEAIQFHHPDRLGTRLVTDPLSGTSFEQVTLPFGTALNAESTGTTTKRFTSYDRSATTGLDYAYNRHYDPQQGRFTQVDPIGMKSTTLVNPQTLNLYAYCTNGPVNHTDPSGLGFFSWLGKLFKTIGKLIAKIVTNKVFLLVVGIALGVLAGFGFYWAATIRTQFYLNAAIALSAMSALLIVGAFHPNFLRVVQSVGGILSSIQGVVGLIQGTINGTVLGTLGTPPWNPEAGTGVGAVSTFMAVGQGRKRRWTGVDILLGNIAIAKRNLGARWNDFIATINNNKNAKISTELALCQASQESSFFTLTDTGSGFTESTPGRDQEIGLMQIKPDTARSLGVDPAQLTDVATNVTTGTGYLTGLINRYGDLRTALGVYKQDSLPLTPKSRQYADQIIQCTKQVKY
jgi:RHS repeat-associated protein